MGRIRRISSFSDFKSTLKEQNPSKISIERWQRPQTPFSVSTSWVLGAVGDFNFGLLYRVQSQRDKVRRYGEVLYQAFQSQHGVGDEAQRRKTAVGLFLAAEARMFELREWVPDSEIVVLQSPSGKTADAAFIQRVHSDAARYGVVLPVHDPSITLPALPSSEIGPLQ